MSVHTLTLILTIILELLPRPLKVANINTYVQLSVLRSIVKILLSKILWPMMLRLIE